MTMKVDEPVEEPLLHPATVAARLNVPISWVYRAAREDRLPCVRTGRYVRFRPADVEEFIKKGGER